MPGLAAAVIVSPTPMEPSMTSLAFRLGRNLVRGAVLGALALPVVPVAALAQATDTGGAMGAGTIATSPPAGTAHGGRHGEAHSRGPHAHRGEAGLMGGHHDPMRFLRGLDLSEQQHDRIFEIVHRQAPAMRERAKAVGRARQELGALAMSAQYDEGRAKALSDGLAAAAGEMAMERARTANAVWQLLTPEQRRQVEERTRARRLQPGGPMRG